MIIHTSYRAPLMLHHLGLLTLRLPWRMLCRRYDGGCFAAPISLGPADTLPPLLLLLWRMLCRRVCAAVWSSLVDASPLWSCLFWWMLGHPLVVFVVSWRPRWCCSSCRFICVRLFRGSWRVGEAFCSVVVVLLVLWLFVFIGLFSIFSLLLLLCVLVPVNSCLASIKLCL